MIIYEYPFWPEFTSEKIQNENGPLLNGVQVTQILIGWITDQKLNCRLLVASHRDHNTTIMYTEKALIVCILKDKTV
jgi:hypothetical protein